MSDNSNGGGMAALALNLTQLGGKLLMGLLAAHDKRVAEAKAENSAVNAALAALKHDVQVIVDGFNQGTITNSAAIQACLDVDTWYWQYINPYTQYKNASHAQCNPDQLGDNAKLAAIGTRCWQSTQPNQASHFTAASDIGCNIVDANLGMLRAILIQLQKQPSGSSAKYNFCGWPTNKYGLTSDPGMTLTLTVPQVVTPEEVTLSSTGILSVGAAPTSSTVAVVQSGAVVSSPQQQASQLQSLASGFSMSNLLLLVGAGLIVALLTGARK